MSTPTRPKPGAALTKKATEPALIQPEDQEGIIDEITKQIGNAVMSARVSSWMIGYYLNLALENEGKYGAHIVEKSAEALSRPPRLMWDMLKFYKNNTSLTAVKSMGIEWSSARVLLTVKDTDMRDKLQAEAEEASMTVLEVKALVKKALAGTAEEKNKDRESAQPRQVKPISYFKRLLKQLTEFKGQMDNELGGRFAQYQVLGDTVETSDEEYNDCVAKVGEVVAKANSILLLLENNIAAMPKEMDEALDEAEKAEQKK